MEKFELDFFDGDSLERYEVIDGPAYSQPDDMPDLEDDDEIFELDDRTTSNRLLEL